MLAILALVGSGCASETTVRLTVIYEDAWGLDELEVAANGRSARVDPSHEVLLWLNEPWTDEEITIEVTGFRDGERMAFGTVAVLAVFGTEVSATVALSRLPCGVWCTEGARACEDDGVVVCAQEEDGCMRWSPRVACPTAVPFCSFGTCDTECVDECAQDEQRCFGPRGAQQCGQGDSDPCLEWLVVTACAEGETCARGDCVSECVDECDESTVQCQDSGVSSCADRDLDGCTEWGPTQACADGESCEGGRCRPIGTCTDECAANACNDTTLTQCGNYDLDPCLEPSSGVSCASSDPCTEGRCTLDGCQSMPRVCDSPPASTCVDASTLRTFGSTGTCSVGACEYPSSDSICSNGCANGRCLDACDGVACVTPPNACYEPTGTCSGEGMCTYSTREGSCDDGDACTEGDLCQGGACAGAPIVCGDPPQPSCFDPNTLRTYASSGSCAGGTCSYVATDIPCPAGCEFGRCLCEPGADPSCGCAPGTFDFDLGVPGCECVAQPAIDQGLDCANAIDLGNLSDTGQMMNIDGNVLPGDRGVYYSFRAVDVADTTCDEFHVRVRVLQNPNDAFEVSVYRGICAAMGCGEGISDYRWATDFGAVNAGQCPCWASPAPAMTGVSHCSDDSSRFYIRVRRRAAAALSCDGYRIEVSNGVYSST